MNKKFSLSTGMIAVALIVGIRFVRAQTANSPSIEVKCLDLQTHFSIAISRTGMDSATRQTVYKAEIVTADGKSFTYSDVRRASGDRPFQGPPAEYQKLSPVARIPGLSEVILDLKLNDGAPAALLTVHDSASPEGPNFTDQALNACGWNTPTLFKDLSDGRNHSVRIMTNGDAYLVDWKASPDGSQRKFLDSNATWADFKSGDWIPNPASDSNQPMILEELIQLTYLDGSARTFGLDGVLHK